MSEQDIPTPLVSTAIQMIYCGVCSLPPEYCEYGPTLNKCKEWLQEKHSELFDKLYSQTEQNTPTTLTPIVSVSTAIQVIYCGVCSLPPEYCEYGLTLDKCKEWLREKHSELFDKLYSQTNLENYVATLSLENKPANDVKDKKKAKEAAKIERELQKKMASKVTITRIARNKRKSVTNVGGLQNFDIDLKKAAKSFASKFACGSSVVKNNQGIDEIVVQGDVSDDLYEYILETWPDVPEDNIELAEEKKSKK